VLTPRERVLRTLRFEHPGAFPKDLGFTPAAAETFRRETGCGSADDYFGLEVRRVGPRLATPMPDFRPYFDEGELPESAFFSAYGSAHVPGDFYHFTRMHFPAKHFDSVAQYEGYPWPEFSYADDAAETVSRLQAEGWAVGGWAGDIWEPAWQVRGMDNLMFDFMERPEMAAYLLDRITDNAAHCAAQAAEAGCDLVMFGDDVAMQDRMMMSIPMWREWLFPCLRRAVRAARAVNPSIHVWYHSDGDVWEAIPGLIEAGVNVLNPVQPECVDPKAIRAEYGRELAFWGCVGTQTTFPFGTPAEMKRVVWDLMDTVGESGGLLLAPTHVLEPDVPWANIEAFREAIEEAAEGRR
jgi:uroporphyrinogen decarboxylase